MDGATTTIQQGRLGGDPEVKTTKNDKIVCNFSVAVDYGYGEYKETIWFKCVAWGKAAETLGKYLHKGDMVCLTGNVKASGYVNKSGEVGATLDFTVQGWRFLVTQKSVSSEDREGSDETPKESKGFGKKKQAEPPPEVDDEIEF